MSLYAKYSIFGREFMQAGLWLANNLSLFAITMTQPSKTGPGPAGIFFAITMTQQSDEANLTPRQLVTIVCFAITMTQQFFQQNWHCFNMLQF